MSLRGRLAAFFALGSASVLLASTALLYVNLDRQLTAAVDEGLRSRADDIEADIAAGSVQIRREEPFAQILGADGTVISSSPTIGSGRRLLTDEELARALRDPVWLKRPGSAGDARLLAEPVDTGGRTVVLVVGTHLEAIERARQRLAVALVVAAPLLAGTLAGGGWFLTGAALRPVGQMAEEAEAISLAEPGRRLPQPPGDDEIAHLGRTLNAMLDRIEASFARERAFVDDASHELRTPLSILRAELELALVTLREGGDVTPAVTSALEEAERLSRLADDLLLLARSGARQLPLRRSAVDLAELARRVAARMATEGVRVRVEGRGVTAVVDESRIDQVLTNLVDNARRHARSTVVVHLGARNTGVEIIVADDGPGFPPELLPVVFDRFTRASPSRGRDDGGAGLGLSIVAALVQAHGGSVEARNEGLLGGAEVRVRLPR